MKKLLPLLLLLATPCLAQYEPRTSYLAGTEVVPDNYLIMGDGLGGMESASIGRTGGISLVTTPHGNCGSTETFSAYNGFHTATLDAALTVTLADFDSTGFASSMTIRFTQDGTGGRVITTWPREVVTAPLINPTASSITAVTLITTDGGTTIYATSDYSTEVLIVCLSDETTALTTGNGKALFRAPYAMHIIAVKASVTTTSSSGTPTFDINDSGTTILSTPLTIDVSEKTSATAAIAAAISDPDIALDAELRFDIDVAGTDTAGAKIMIYFTRS